MRKLFALIALLGLVAIAPGCTKEESTGDKVDNAINNATDAADDAKKDGEKMMDDAKKDMPASAPKE